MLAGLSRKKTGINQGSQYGNSYFDLYPSPSHIDDLIPVVKSGKRQTSIILPEIWAVLEALAKEGSDKAFQSFEKILQVIPTSKLSNVKVNANINAPKVETSRSNTKSATVLQSSEVPTTRHEELPSLFFFVATHQYAPNVVSADSVARTHDFIEAAKAAGKERFLNAIHQKISQVISEASPDDYTEMLHGFLAQNTWDIHCKKFSAPTISSDDAIILSASNSAMDNSASTDVKETTRRSSLASSAVAITEVTLGGGQKYFFKLADAYLAVHEGQQELALQLFERDNYATVNIIAVDNKGNALAGAKSLNLIEFARESGKSDIANVLQDKLTAVETAKAEAEQAKLLQKAREEEQRIAEEKRQKAEEELKIKQAEELAEQKRLQEVALKKAEEEAKKQRELENKEARIRELKSKITDAKNEGEQLDRSITSYQQENNMLKGDIAQIAQEEKAYNEAINKKITKFLAMQTKLSALTNKYEDMLALALQMLAISKKRYRVDPRATHTITYPMPVTEETAEHNSRIERLPTPPLADSLDPEKQNQVVQEMEEKVVTPPKSQSATPPPAPEELSDTSARNQGNEIKGSPTISIAEKKSSISDTQAPLPPAPISGITQAEVEQLQPNKTTARLTSANAKDEKKETVAATTLSQETAPPPSKAGQMAGALMSMANSEKTNNMMKSAHQLIAERMKAQRPLATGGAANEESDSDDNNFDSDDDAPMQPSTAKITAYSKQAATVRKQPEEIAKQKEEEREQAKAQAKQQSSASVQPQPQLNAAAKKTGSQKEMLSGIFTAENIAAKQKEQAEIAKREEEREQAKAQTKQQLSASVQPQPQLNEAAKKTGSQKEMLSSLFTTENIAAKQKEQAEKAKLEAEREAKISAK